MPLTNRSIAAACAFACVALAVPAAAAAADWQRLGQAPGGDSFVVVAGTPYVAYTSKAGVRVAKFGGTAGKWSKVGAAVRHKRGDGVRYPALAAGPDGKTWLTWTEGTDKSGYQVRVARFAKGKWREVVGGKDPISAPRKSQLDQSKKVFTSSRPSLAFLRSRPYVAYLDSGLDSFAVVARLSSNGRRWRDVSKGLGGVGSEDPKLANAGGKLFLEYRDRTHAAPICHAFNATNSKWKTLPLVQNGESAKFGGMVGFHDTLWTLFSESSNGDVFVSALERDDTWSHVGPHLATDPAITPQSIATDGGTVYAAYVNGEQHVDVFALTVDSTWARLEQPTPAGSTADSAALAGAAGGGAWLLAHETTAGKTSFQLELNGLAE